jgi:hypothetical protein
LKASIVKLMYFKPRKLYLTHYSEVGDCSRLANDMYHAIDDFVTIARRAGLDERRMKFELRQRAHESLAEHGCKLTPDAIDAILNKDFELNAAGLAHWLKREHN